MEQGKEVILVSSGAIATASPLIGLAAKPEDLATSQALASIGQARLMGRYERSLARHDRLPGQVLLTVENIADEQSSENASRALERLISLGVLPIINENDSVATQEIRFGDNDQLAARVAILTGADLLILFPTSTRSTRSPQLNPVRSEFRWFSLARTSPDCRSRGLPPVMAPVVRLLRSLQHYSQLRPEWR